MLQTKLPGSNDVLINTNLLHALKNGLKNVTSILKIMVRFRSDNQNGLFYFLICIWFSCLAKMLVHWNLLDV